MKFDSKTVRKTINKAFLKEPVERTAFNNFKETLQRLLDQIESAENKGEHEEHFKNFLEPFFNSVGFDDYKINTSGRIDLAIYIGSKSKDPVGVLMEVKRPSNANEMITKENLNRKAMHEAVLYYLEQRIEQDNSDLKHIIITGMNDWFIFDAQEFERCFYKPFALRKMWEEWKADRKVSSNNDFMYREISRFMQEQETAISGLWIPLHKSQKLLKGKEDSDYEKKLIPLYKLFTPTHLLKEPFANDSNSLNREFYRELLYILGLEETKKGGTRYIQRAEEDKRHSGSLIENTIRILDSEDHLSTLKNERSSYGANREEQLFSVAMELSITWMNRVLFLKLLEAQLYRYHRQDPKFKFLNYRSIDGLDELNKLFFQVLARKEKDRTGDVNEKFGHIPYLNSSLFDVSTLEHQTTRISGLDDHEEIPVYSKSVLTDNRGETLNTLDYLFRFLEAYDFSAEGAEEIRDESKSLINASVLGLIFEKINGYKDGSFYTPGFITEYMARETLRKAVVDKFTSYFNNGEDPNFPLERGLRGVSTESDAGQETNSTEHPSNENAERISISSPQGEISSLDFKQIYNRIGRDISITEANELINSITICDPAVGSGHFLVSCLNELIAIKSELGILSDTDGKILRGVEVVVENDELIISWGDEGLFEYDLSHTWKGNELSSRKVSPELERVQKALFHEKRYLIENCLFGVDINPNSVKICRLRLWIELLKRAYYTKESDYLELEVLPNIDINIKQGNSLISRFELDSDLSSVFSESDYSLDDYKEAVRSYKHTGDRTEKQRLQELINDIKEEYTTTLTNIRPINKKLSKARGKLELMQSDDLFGDVKFTKKDIKKQKKKVAKLEKEKADEEAGAFYNEAFEWRFEFPEVLDDEGRFTGFDVVIGNPPYLRPRDANENLLKYYRENFKVSQNQIDLYHLFLELSSYLTKYAGKVCLIIPNSFLANENCENLREYILNKVKIMSIIDSRQNIFPEANVDVAIIILSKEIDENHISKYMEVVDNEFIYKNEFNKTLFKKNKNKNFSVTLDENEQIILNKLHAGKELKEKFKVTSGIKEYQKGKGKPPQTNLEKEERRFNSQEKLSELYIPEIRGRNINKYLIDWKNEFIKYGEWLAEPRSPEIFNGEKIIIRQIPGRDSLLAAYTKEHFIVDQTAYVIKAKDNENLLVLLAILNSKLIFWFFSNVFNEFDELFPKIKVKEVKSLPLPIEPEVDLLKKLQDLACRNHSKKKKDNQADTSELEKEIDRLVYELYGVSEEEIGIVEGSV